MTADILPDSRLKRADLKTVMADWKLPDGTTVRIEVCPVFCANCGAEHGFVPKDNTSWAFFLCDDCYEKWGVPANLMVESDTAFWERVHYEMLEKHGHVLTADEIFRLHEEGRLGKGLELLMKESPLPQT